MTDILLWIKNFKYAASHSFIHIKHICNSHTQVFNSLTEISFDAITKEAKESLPGKSEVNNALYLGGKNRKKRLKKFERLIQVTSLVKFISK